ncbi:hypothetical protein C8R46DRAFT_1072354 [Mycena filopes]|nr:hypothetical protein C8R46DRAFT_1072354 [Mycena filopes]
MPPTVFITGASKGIGLAVTTILLRKFGANVLVELLGSASESLLLVDGDVSDEAAVANAVAQGIEKFSTIDALVLNAATLEPLCRIGDATSLDSWKTHFDISFFSLVSMLKAALPALRKSEAGGRVIFVSSGAAVKGTAGWGPYNASKAAMNSLCRTLAEEEPGIVSVALRPGMVSTGMQAALRESGAAIFVNTHADGKLLRPEEPGHVIAALALQAAKSLSGQFVSWDSQECADYRA